MIPDDLCEKHGTVLSLSRRKDGGLHKYCNACRREQRGGFHYGGPTCRRGHLKTPWSWRWNKGCRNYYCHTCMLERKRARNRSKAA